MGLAAPPRGAIRVAMRILYYSVHSVLEHDEVTLLRSLGHEVFPLGEYFDAALGQGMRPMADPGPGHAALLERFHAEGCQFRRFSAPEETVLTPGFVALFDLVVVMHSAEFIEHHWGVLAGRPIILRTIGVGLPWREPRIAALRARGVRVIRYAETERRAPNYAGHDAVIRFAKDPAAFDGWQGDAAQALMFSMAFRERFPEECALWEAIAPGLPLVLGGASNEGIPGAIGFQLPNQQMALLRTSRAYLYCSGLPIPYTLNFIEAWMMGIPLLALDPALVTRPHNCTEWPGLIRRGQDALLARDPREARAMLRNLLNDHGLARQIGQAGRARAIALFGTAVIAPQWQAALAWA